MQKVRIGLSAQFSAWSVLQRNSMQLTVTPLRPGVNICPEKSYHKLISFKFRSGRTQMCPHCILRSDHWYHIGRWCGTHVAKFFLLWAQMHPGPHMKDHLLSWHHLTRYSFTMKKLNTSSQVVTGDTFRIYFNGRWEHTYLTLSTCDRISQEGY